MKVNKMKLLRKKLAWALCLALVAVAAISTLAAAAYEGEYDSSGKRSGHGVWTYEDDRYEGQWKDGAPNGSGTLYWKRSTPVENKEPGRTYAMETTLTGDFVNGYAHGAVTEVWHMDNGEVHTWNFTVDMGHAVETEVWSTTSQADLTISPDQVFGVLPWSRGELPEGEAAADTQPQEPALAASPTASTVLVNGEQVAFDAYNINGNNYFKLRDLAYAINGSEKQFEVAWDGANNAISLTSGQPYTIVGGEMSGGGAGDKTPTATTSKILLNGKDEAFSAYNIDGNNYFRLRDIGLAFDFSVEWDGARNTIVIDTSKGYTPE